MAKLILSGDLSTFRIEMVVRILEAIKFDGELTVEGLERGAIYMLGGKVVGAKGAMDQGFMALVPITTQRAGTFSVRQTTAEEVLRHPDLVALPDNAAVFRQAHALLGEGRFAAAAAPAATVANLPSAPPPARSNPSQTVVERSRAPVATGPMGRVPEITDKGKVTLRTIQTNYAMRGVQVDADTWRILAKIDGTQTLFQIATALNVMGERFDGAIQQLQNEGYIRFQTHDPGLDHLTKRTEAKFRFGEYMVAKGIITEVQLEAALRRQQELARRGRYMWLGEILVELNYARPSQVQEALAVQKRMGS